MKLWMIVVHIMWILYQQQWYYTKQWSQTKWSLVLWLRFSSAEVFILFRFEHTLCTRKFSVGKKSTIQYGNRKCGTHARVFSQTLAHGNNKNEDKETEEGKKRGVSMERNKAIKYNNNNKHNMLVLYKSWKNYNELQLTNYYYYYYDFTTVDDISTIQQWISVSHEGLSTPITT